MIAILTFKQRSKQTNNNHYLMFLASKRKKDDSQALFTFSPFGLSCRRCENNVSLQIDARRIQIHLKKHGLDSRAFLVRTLVDGFMSQVLNAKASGSIEPYKSTVLDSTPTTVCRRQYHATI
jgi:hypothetical protein